MDYITLFKEKFIESSVQYPQNDIGIARLFYDLHSGFVRYVPEAKTWYAYNGQRWNKDNGGFKAMELCKLFTQSFGEYAVMTRPDDSEFLKWAGKLTSRCNREGILRDAMSIAPVSISDFDKDVMLLNVVNGTLNLRNFSLQPHNPADMITKLAPVKYNPKARCQRWDKFIDEVMCGDMALATYLQKALGYALTGLTEYEIFFILYGQKTRNGKTTLVESIANLLGDYTSNAQAQSLAKRCVDGAAASPDMARLKGARLVTVPEPEKGLELNIALIKQLTGGDTYTARFLNANPFEFKPEFKLFINTNHLPRTADDTVFTSGRVKIIPFDRHFSESEQDKGLKKHFRERNNKSAILNWLLDGYRSLLESGFDTPAKVIEAIEAYRSEADIIGVFLSEYTCSKEDGRVPTSELYSLYMDWAKANGYKPLSNRNVTIDIHRRYEIRRTGADGRVIIGITIKS
jgi:putative DNA primase/helicase